MNAWGYGVWAFAAGVLIPVMAALNGGLGRAIGSAAWAAVILFTVALAASLVAAGAQSGPPRTEALAAVRPEQLGAGLVVAFYVLTATYLTPRFGVAPTILCVVAAQIVTAAVIGHFGWLGAPVQRMDVLRLAGLALMLGGLFLTQLRRG